MNNEVVDGWECSEEMVLFVLMNIDYGKFIESPTRASCWICMNIWGGVEQIL